MCTEKCSVKQMFTNGFAPTNSVKKIIQGVKTYWLFGTENVSCAAVSKNYYADSLFGHKTKHPHYFLEKGATLISASD